MNLKELAEKAEKKTTKNIADLETVSINTPIVNKIYKEGTDDEYDCDIIEVDGQDYRVPFTVTLSLKELLKKFPNLQKFSVMRTGTGITDTKYQVIPLGV